MSYYIKNNLDKAKLVPGELFEALYGNKAPRYVREENPNHLWLKETKPKEIRPYLTRTNKSTSNPLNKNDYERQKTREDSKYLANSLEQLTPLQSLHAVKFGDFKIKRLNDNEFHVYRVPNRSGNSSMCSGSSNLMSFSTNARFSARNRLIETIKANDDFKYFFTGTFNPKKWNVFNFSELHSKFTRFLRRRGIKYILIPEPHKSGAIHFHGLFNESIEPYLKEFDISQKLPSKITDAIKKGHDLYNFPDYAKMFGWVSIEKIRNFEACANYVSKYVSKSFDDESRFSYRRYFCSTGLKKPEFVPFIKNIYSFDKIYSEIIPKVVYRRSAGGVGTVPPRVEAPPSVVGEGFNLNAPPNFSH